MGSGASCAVCDAVVSRQEVEVEFLTTANGHADGTYRMHVACFTAWECELLDGTARGVSSGAVGAPGNATYDKRTGRSR